MNGVHVKKYPSCESARKAMSVLRKCKGLGGEPRFGLTSFAKVGDFNPSRVSPSVWGEPRSQRSRRGLDATEPARNKLGQPMFGPALSKNCNACIGPWRGSRLTGDAYCLSGERRSCL